MRINFHAQPPQDDDYEAEDFESDSLSQTPQDGPLRACLADDPEHDRMLDPAY